MILYEGASKTYPGGVTAVQDLDLAVEPGQVLVLLGTSGSGKTTAMKMVNRLIELSAGRVLVDGVDVRDHDPIALRRRIGYAVQDIGLFPHLTVAGNIGVVPELLDWPGGRIEERVRELLGMVGLEPDAFAKRYPRQLSGGQQQRVGVARALAADPDIALMDEPFGALDPITRQDLQDGFLQLQKQLRKTILFVTHDVFEAVKLGDRIAVLDAGVLQQVCTPADLVRRPANAFVEQFLEPQRLQLSLLTRKLRDVLEPDALDVPGETSSGEPGLRLDLEDNLAAALDAFDRSGAESLPVYDGGHCRGELDRDRMLTAVFGNRGARGAGGFA